MDENNKQGINQGGSQGTETDYQALAKLAGQLALLSSLILNSTTDLNLLIEGSIINLIADVLFVLSAFLESEEQQIAPGTTTHANRLKVIGTIGGLVSALILFKAQLIETAIKEQATVTGIPPLTIAAGAFQA